MEFAPSELSIDIHEFFLAKFSITQAAWAYTWEPGTGGPPRGPPERRLPEACFEGSPEGCQPERVVSSRYWGRAI